MLSFFQTGENTKEKGDKLTNALTREGEEEAKANNMSRDEKKQGKSTLHSCTRKQQRINRCSFSRNSAEEGDTKRIKWRRPPLNSNTRRTHTQSAILPGSYECLSAPFYTLKHTDNFLCIPRKK